MSDIDWCEAYAEDDPRYQYGESTFAPAPGTWAPDCGHPACLADDRGEGCLGGGGCHYWDCPVAACRWDTARSGCDLPASHDGDHSYALPATPEARLVPYEAPEMQVVVIQVVPDDASVGQPAGSR